MGTSTSWPALVNAIAAPRPAIPAPIMPMLRLLSFGLVRVKSGVGFVAVGAAPDAMFEPKPVSRPSNQSNQFQRENPNNAETVGGERGAKMGA